MKEVVKALKAERKLHEKAIKQVDAALAKLGKVAGGKGRKRRAKKVDKPPEKPEPKKVAKRKSASPSVSVRMTAPISDKARRARELAASAAAASISPQ